MSRTWKFGFLLAPVLAIAMGCGGGEDPDAPEIEQTIRNMIQAWNQQDADTFVDSWTASALQERLGANEAEIRENAEEFLGEPSRTVRDISNISVRAGSAFARVEIEAGRAVYSDRYILVEQGGSWVIEAADQVEPDLSGGTDMLEVEMVDSEFRFDASEAEDGDIAFQAENLGSMAHELTVWRVPSGFDLDEALANGGQAPADVEVIGSTGPVAPEVTGWFALVEPLEQGSYVMLCLLPDPDHPDEASHASQGMVGEFEVTTASASAP